MTPADAGHLTTIAAIDCHRLLATHQVGRLAVNADGYPLIFVVNYTVDDGAVIIRTHAGTKLTAADHANVSFEVDHIDEHTRSGWSILVRGRAEEVTDELERARLVERHVDSGTQPWAPGEHGRWLRLVPVAISGRQVVPGELPPPFPDSAYL